MQRFFLLFFCSSVSKYRWLSIADNKFQFYRMSGLIQKCTIRPAQMNKVFIPGTHESGPIKLFKVGKLFECNIL